MSQITEFSSVSWKTFKSAAEFREDDISKSMKGKWEFGPFGGYHRKCYQNYTAKSHIARVVTKRRKIDEDDSTVTVAEQQEESHVSLTRSSFSPQLSRCVGSARLRKYGGISQNSILSS